MSRFTVLVFFLFTILVFNAYSHPGHEDRGSFVRPIENAKFHNLQVG